MSTESAKPARPHPTLPPWEIFHTPRGIAVFNLNYWADPDKTPETIATLRTQMGEKRFKRELLKDWTSAAGDSFYPEFSLNGGRRVYCYDPPELLAGPIYRFWDFGFRRPAVVWAQKGKGEDGRLYVLRELMPGWVTGVMGDIDARSFRDAVLYVSGQLASDRLSTPAQNLILKLAEDPDYPPPPWFQPAYTQQFIDFTGPEALMVSDIAAETQERTRLAILEEAGLSVSWRDVSWKAREDIMRDLLLVRPDGRPNILFASPCKILLQALEGGLTFARPTKEEPIPSKPAKDGYHDHLHDALSYGVAQLYSPTRGRAVRLPDTFVGRRRVSGEAAARQEQVLPWAASLGARSWGLTRRRPKW